jgi:hypothetical protein
MILLEAPGLCGVTPKKRRMSMTDTICRARSPCPAQNQACKAKA